MKKIALALFLAALGVAHGQGLQFPFVYNAPSDPTGAACGSGTGIPQLQVYQAGDKVDFCGSGNIWAAISSGGGSGTVTSVTGTANQIDVATGTTTPVISLDPSLILPAGTTGLPVATGISGLGTGVATALAVNVGSAGAPVTSGGALGTPSSGVITNLTGTCAACTATTATNLAAGTIGQIPYQSAANTTAYLAANTAATDQVLVSHGSGAAGLAPTLSNAPALAVTNMTGAATLTSVTMTNIAQVSNSAAAAIGLGSTSIINWSSGVCCASRDTTIDRAAPGVVEIGNVGATQGSGGSLKAQKILTSANCANGASPAVCAAASAGAVAIPTGVNSTLVVNTTAITANSQILLTVDDSVTIGGTTCNSTLATLVGGTAITARTAATSFTISFNGTITTNPVCISYSIIN